MVVVLWCLVLLLGCLCLVFSLEEGYGPIRGTHMYVFVGLGDGDYVCQLPCVWYYVFVESSFKHNREKCSAKRA